MMQSIRKGDYLAVTSVACFVLGTTIIYCSPYPPYPRSTAVILPWVSGLFTLVAAILLGAIDLALRRSERHLRIAAGVSAMLSLIFLLYFSTALVRYLW